MEEDRKKRELRAQELDVKGDEGILQFYTQFCGTNCKIKIIEDFLSLIFEYYF